MANTDIPIGPSQEEIYIPCPHGLRAAAWLIDSLILVSVFAFLPQPLNYLLLLALFVAYHAVLIWLVEQTVGKALLGLKVKRIGKKPGFFWALGRASVGYCFVDLLGAGVLVAFFNRRHLCLHDYVFGSVVIFEGAGAIRAGTLLSRLVEFAERQRQAVDAKKKTLVTLAGLWAFLAGLGNALKKAIYFLTRLGSGTSTSTSAPSIAEALSLKAAVAITAATTAITGAVVTNVPIVRDAAHG